MLSLSTHSPLSGRPWLVLAVVLWLLHPATVSTFLPRPPAEHPLTPPAAATEHALAAPHLLSANLRLWLWPYGQDSCLRAVDTRRTGTSGAISALVLALALRHAWRLRRHNPWVFLGIAGAALGLLPIVAIPGIANRPVADAWLLVPAIPLSLMVASVLRQSLSALQCRKGIWWHRLAFGALAAAAVIWAAGALIETVTRVRRGEVDRLRRAVEVQREPAAAVALARHLAETEGGPDDLAESRRQVVAARRVIPWYGGLADATLAIGPPPATEVRIGVE